MQQGSGFGFTFGFPFDLFGCGCGPEPATRKERLLRKISFLKRIRDDLEARLAGLNAALTTLERQASEEEAA
ncbi:hypothetical protein [Anthocerotibacter panamensis]|uniref:hypothetical protein n=1 Tax=Anthocerotibacter panamensis TaxID=2857077 RepID=UPI001C40553D|nr:hypothetical protein [Anthocerotibacter panamensis]